MVNPGVFKNDLTRNFITETLDCRIKPLKSLNESCS